MANFTENRPVLLNFWGKRATSFVWNYFGFEADANGRYKDPKKAICRICYHPIKYFGNTTNMAHHLGTHNDIAIPTPASAKIEIVQPNFQHESNDSYEPAEKVPRNDLMVVEFWSKSKRSVVWEYFGFYATADGEYVDKNETVCKLCQTCLRYNGNTTNLANHLLRYHGIEGILTSHDPNLCLASEETTERVNEILKAAVALQKPGETFNVNDSSDHDSSQGSQIVGLGGSSSRLPPNSSEGPRGERMNLAGSNDHVTTTTNEVGLNNRRKSTPHPLVIGTIENQSITSDRLSTITSAIGNYLMEERLAVGHVASPGFVRFVRSLESSYKMPSPEFFQGSLFRRQVSTISVQLEGMKEAKRHVLTEHKWTLKAHDSQAHDKTYKTLIISYIDDEFQRKSHILQTIEGNLNKSTLSRICEKWGMKDLVMIVQAHNHVQYGVVQVLCFAATVKSALLKVFQETETRDVLVKCARTCLEDIDFIIDNSLTDIILQLSTLRGVHDNNPWKVNEMLKYYLSISVENDQQNIQVIVDIFKSLKTALDMLTAKSSTAALILPTLYKLIQKQFLPSNSDTGVIKEVKSSLANTMRDTYFKETSINKLLKVSTVMDPRLKSLDWMEDEEKESCYALLEEEALGVVISSEALLKIKREPDEEIGPGQANANVCLDDQTNDLSFLADVLRKPKSTSSLTPEEEVKSEIRHYLGEKNGTGATNGLTWWATRAEAYPILSMLARKYLCIPATGLDTNRVIQYPVSCVDTQPSIDEIDQLMFVYNNSGKSSTEERYQGK